MQPGETPTPRSQALQSPFQARLQSDLAGLETEIRALETEREQVKADIRKYQARVENAPKNEAVLTRLMRDNENMRANYRSLLNKRLEADLAEKLEHELQGEQFNVVDRAIPPSFHFKPDLRQIVVFGSIAGLLISIVLMFLLHQLQLHQERLVLETETYLDQHLIQHLQVS